ncbi:hypothetical protein [Iningainema tapete]|nr:hypothetical protein [Iningainema tapete]
MLPCCQKAEVRSCSDDLRDLRRPSRRVSEGQGEGEGTQARAIG